MFRMIIAIDLDAESLEVAYARIYKMMGELAARHDVDWESTDEAYDRDGNAVDADELQRARERFFAKREATGGDQP